jgi:hypothetical protein
MTRWSPDTCDCVVEYDNNLQVTAVINRCKKHQDTANDAVHLSTVLAHNRRKNTVLNATRDHLKEIGLSPDVVSVVYDDADRLHIVGSGLSSAEQTKLTDKLGIALNFAG